MIDCTGARRLREWVAGLVLSVLFLLPVQAAQGLTLGAMEVKSHLGEPFHATVTIILGSKEIAIPLVAAKAQPKDYESLGLEHHELIGNLILSMEGKGSQRRLLVTTRDPIQVPFFNFLLKLSTEQGDHFRNYPTFLEVRPSPLSREFQPPVLLTPTHSLSDQNRTATNKDEYGPIRPGETLIGIAEQFTTPPHTRYQVLAAFYALNKSLLVNGNMNGLPVGVILKIPPREQFEAMNADQAKTLAATQRQEWTQNLVASTPRPSVTTDTTRKPKAGKDLAKPIVSVPPRVEKTGEIVDMRLTVSPADKEDTLTLSNRISETKDTNTARNSAVPATPSPATPAAQQTEPAKKLDPTEGKPSVSLELNASNQLAATGEMDHLKKEVASLADQLKQSESSRSQLQLQLATLEGRFKKLEQDRQSQPPPPVETEVPWDLVAAGGTVVVLVTGLLGWLSFRGRKKGLAEDPTLLPQAVPVTSTSRVSSLASNSIMPGSRIKSVPVQAPPPDLPSPPAQIMEERDQLDATRTDSGSRTNAAESTQPITAPSDKSDLPPDTSSKKKESNPQKAAYAGAMGAGIIAASSFNTDGNEDNDGVLDLGGEDEETENIFNLGDDRPEVPEKKTSQFNDVAPAPLLDPGHGAFAPSPSTPSDDHDEDRTSATDSSALMEIGIEEASSGPLLKTIHEEDSSETMLEIGIEEASSGPLLEIGIEEASSGPLLEIGIEEASSGPLLKTNREADSSGSMLEIGIEEGSSGPLLEIGIEEGSSGPLIQEHASGRSEHNQPIAMSPKPETELETLTFEVPSMEDVPGRPPSEPTKAIEVETITFDLDETPVPIHKKVTQTPDKKKYESSANGHRLPENNHDDDLPELELITDEAS
ncbi:MAG: hypothetical protein HQL89_10215 [Magnetococcales bacterium]|nr:hypothetical protein [Magnetococcales bacterium]